MKHFLTILLVCIKCVTHAQTLSEWTQQNKTQLKYLVEQITALQVYASYAEKGYAIAKKGLDAIGNIKKKDLFIHKSYLNSLKMVNPHIKSYWKVADIIAMQMNIVKSSRKQIKSIREGGQFTEDETNYSKRVIANLLDEFSTILDQLIFQVSDGNTEMTDDERLKRIDDLYTDAKDKYQFEQHFSNETTILTIQRYLEGKDIQTTKTLMNQ